MVSCKTEVCSLGLRIQQVGQARSTPTLCSRSRVTFSICS